MCSPDIFFIFRMVEKYCLVIGAQHDVIMRVPRSHAANALADLVQHASSSNTWTRLWWKSSVCDGKVPLVPQADASWRVGRERTPVDHDGDDEQPHALQRMHLQKLITSPCL